MIDSHNRLSRAAVAPASIELSCTCSIEPTGTGILHVDASAPDARCLIVDVIAVGGVGKKSVLLVLVRVSSCR